MVGLDRTPRSPPPLAPGIIPGWWHLFVLGSWELPLIGEAVAIATVFEASRGLWSTLPNISHEEQFSANCGCQDIRCCYRHRWSAHIAADGHERPSLGLITRHAHQGLSAAIV